MGSACDKKPITLKKSVKKPINEFSKHCDFRTKYEYVSVLGNGAFGKVRLYRDKSYKGMFYAIKTLRKDKISGALFKCLIEEVQILSQLDHPNIVKYYETYEDNTHLHIVMEFLQGDDLLKIIAYNSYKNFNEKDVCFIIKQLIKALLFIHKREIVHRDIKPENILFSKSNDFSTLKLIDFGLATTIEKKDNKSVGTPYFMAPEIFEGKYTAKTDMWSVGVLVHLMLVGKHPFKKGKTMHEICHSICNDELNNEDMEQATCSDEAKDLIRKLLVKNPLKRLSTEDTINHPWFTIISDEKKDTNLTKKVVNTLKEFSQKSSLQKEIFFFIAKISKEEEIKGLREIFAELDTDNTGTLTYNNITEAFNSRGMKTEDRDIKQIWEGLDFHLEGEINYTQFLAAMMSSHINFSKEEKLWTVFQYFETTGNGSNGYISPQSLIKATKTFKLQVNETNITKDFEDLKGKKLDFNHFKELVSMSTGVSEKSK